MQKRYNSANDFFKSVFGGRLIKLSIDAGFTCPNRDGSKAYGGCIFCGERGSGDFTSGSHKTIDDQIDEQKNIMSKKWEGSYAAYFQAFTNTYAPLDRLYDIYTQALKREDISAVFIATRPDCINRGTVDLLRGLMECYNKPVFIELGLQTANESTAEIINRQYNNSDFENACRILKQAGINIICHIILGLPFETKADMLESVSYCCANGADGLKLQLMHILKYTVLAEMFLRNEFRTLELAEYVDIIISCLEIVPANIVIHRLTGDGAKNDLISPEWSLDKRRVLNTINAELKKRDSFQGRLAEL